MKKVFFILFILFINFIIQYLFYFGFIFINYFNLLSIKTSQSQKIHDIWFVLNFISVYFYYRIIK
jgi:hypothetical protein